MKPESQVRADEPESSEDIYSKVVRAGKRTYFFDVKSTRNGDYFLTITESRKKTASDGSSQYTKNKIYLYKEDFAKYSDGLCDVVNFIKRNKPEFFENTDTVQNTPTEKCELSIDEEFDKL